MEEAADLDFVEGEAKLQPSEGDISANKSWSVVDADSSAIFDYKKLELPQPHSNSAIYQSFWVWSPHSLSKSEVPHLNFLYGVDDGIKIWLNGRIIQDQERIGPCNPDEFSCNALPLKEGWNHFMVKVSQGSGQWQFTGRFQSTDFEYLGQLKSSPSKPLN